jgi:hypothetical protein
MTWACSASLLSRPESPASGTEARGSEFTRKPRFACTLLTTRAALQNMRRHEPANVLPLPAGSHARAAGRVVILPRTAAWLYEDGGRNPGTAWRDHGHPDVGCRHPRRGTIRCMRCVHPRRRCGSRVRQRDRSPEVRLHAAAGYLLIHPRPFRREAGCFHDPHCLFRDRPQRDRGRSPPEKYDELRPLVRARTRRRLGRSALPRSPLTCTKSASP